MLLSPVLLLPKPMTLPPAFEVVWNQASSLTALGTAYAGDMLDHAVARDLFEDLGERGFDLESVPISAASLASFDCVVLATDHDAFDYALIQKHAKLIVDTRGVYRSQRSQRSRDGKVDDKVVRA